ncbi:MAG: hypothetical protein J6Y02_15260 [Pseudobutyrivibrio sp.]|nr:hypothetical protein [Pseudobutyrivibrio sp.]
MKKLRPTNEEKVKFIEDLTERLSWYNKGTLEDFSIDDLKKEHSKIPDNVTKPSIAITAEAYLKMLELVNQSSVECSWHGLVKRYGNAYLVHDVLVFPQINSPTSTTTDEKEFAEWQTKLIMDPEFPIHELRLHGHSHVNMNVFSSGVDDKYQKDLLMKVEDGDYYIFFIMNKRMEICVFLYDFSQQVMFDKNDIELKIISCKDDIRQWAKDQLKEYAITERSLPKGKTSLLSYCDDDYSYSYFNNSRPVFKGANNGSK